MSEGLGEWLGSTQGEIDAGGSRGNRPIAPRLSPLVGQIGEAGASNLPTIFVPCPTCRQYSHSLGEDRIAAAALHFETMWMNPAKGYPTDHMFDEQTRDYAQVLVAAIRAAQGTEAGTAETPKSGSVHDGPVANGDAPERRRPIRPKDYGLTERDLPGGIFDDRA